MKTINIYIYIYIVNVSTKIIVQQTVGKHSIHSNLNLPKITFLKSFRRIHESCGNLQFCFSSLRVLYDKDNGYVSTYVRLHITYES